MKIRNSNLKVKKGRFKLKFLRLKLEITTLKLECGKKSFTMCHECASVNISWSLYIIISEKNCIEKKNTAYMYAFYGKPWTIFDTKSYFGYNC